MSFTPHHILFEPHLYDSGSVPLPYRDTASGCAGRLVNFCDYVTIREALDERRPYLNYATPFVRTKLHPWIGGEDFRYLAGLVRTACANFVPRDYVPTAGTGLWQLADHALQPATPDLTTTITDSDFGLTVPNPAHKLRSLDHIRRMFRDLANMRRMVFCVNDSLGNWSYKFTFTYDDSTQRDENGTVSPYNRNGNQSVINHFHGNYDGVDGWGNPWSTGERWESLGHVTPTLVGALQDNVRTDTSFALRGGWAIGVLHADKSYIGDGDQDPSIVDYYKSVPMAIDPDTHVIDTTAISGPAIKAFCQECGYGDNETVWAWDGNGTISHLMFDIDFPTNFDDANWNWNPA